MPTTAYNLMLKKLFKRKTRIISLSATVTALDNKEKYQSSYKKFEVTFRIGNAQDS